MNLEERLWRVLEEVKPEIMSYQGDNMMLDGVIDSFELIEVVSALEEEFDLEIDADYVIIENFQTKETILKLMEELLEQ